MAEINYDEQGYAVIWSERDQQYVGLAKRFPSMSWLADTHDEALVGIRRVTDEDPTAFLYDEDGLPD